MMLLRILELSFVALWVVSFVTQIAIPLMRGTPFFPFFRSKTTLAHELEQVRQEIDHERLRGRIQATKLEAEFLRWQNTLASPEAKIEIQTEEKGEK